MATPIEIECQIKYGIDFELQVQKILPFFWSFTIGTQQEKTIFLNYLWTLFSQFKPLNQSMVDFCSFITTRLNYTGQRMALIELLNDNFDDEVSDIIDSIQVYNEHNEPGEWASITTDTQINPIYTGDFTTGSKSMRYVTTSSSGAKGFQSDAIIDISILHSLSFDVKFISVFQGQKFLDIFGVSSDNSSDLYSLFTNDFGLDDNSLLWQNVEIPKEFFTNNLLDIDQIYLNINNSGLEFLIDNVKIQTIESVDSRRITLDCLDFNFVEDIDIYLDTEIDPTPLTLFLDNEINDVPITLFLDSEIIDNGSIAGKSFIVNVPIDITTSDELIRALLDIYVIAPQEYLIKRF